MEPRIIFENDDVIVVDKPAGLLAHSDGADPAGTLAAWLLSRHPQARGVGEPRLGRGGQEIERSGIVHRLDRDTSGVMILAKNQPAFLHLKRQFQERRAKKEYRALVYGLLGERWGTIARPIGRSKDGRRRLAERGARGRRREAVTDWERLQSGKYAGEAFSYLSLRPKTGRMHQLRVHLKAVSRPIVGDRLYAPRLAAASNNLGLARLALHSHTLALALPSGEERVFAAPLPAELEQAAARITPPPEGLERMHPAL